MTSIVVKYTQRKLISKRIHSLYDSLLPNAECDACTRTIPSKESNMLICRNAVMILCTQCTGVALRSLSAFTPRLHKQSCNKQQSVLKRLDDRR